MAHSDVMEEAPFSQEVAEGPATAKAYWVHTSDQKRLRVAHWEQKRMPKGTIFVFQGRTENIEKYGRAVRPLHDAGYAVFAIDWRGRGLSDRLTEDRMMGHVESYSDYQKDVSAMLEAAAKLDLPKPWFLLGHSLGACIGLRALMNGFPVTACAFSAPLWDVNLSMMQRVGAWPYSWFAQLVGQGCNYAPGTKGESYALTTAFEENRLTHDPDMYRYYQSVSENLVEHQTGGPSLGWLYQTLRETRRLSKTPSPNTPCITFCGAKDTIVTIPEVQKRMERWPNGRLQLMENSRHDVLYEVAEIREAVFSAILKHFEASSASVTPLP
jgi:lysophospholipase